MAWAKGSHKISEECDMRLSSLDWAYGMLIFALLGLLMLMVGAPEWHRWASTAGLIFCCMGNIYATMREEL